MPLSEEDQRLLDEMERHLMGHDTDVVSAPQGGRAVSYRNITYGAVLVVLGLIGVIVGVSQSLIVVGVLAFVLMLGGVVLAATPAKIASPDAQTPSAASSPARATTGPSFMDRMNDRWDKRQGER